MAYELTFWSKPYLSVSGKAKSSYESAAEAWKSYQGLTAADETVEIRQDGREIEWQELKMTAEGSAR